MEALEYCTFQAMRELYGVLYIKQLWGEFRAFELQEAFHDEITVPISCVLPLETHSEVTMGAAALEVGIQSF